MSAFLTGVPSAYSNLKPTALMLPQLNHLRTFSLHLAHHEKRNTILPDSAISILLRSLPPSVRNLEVDTEGVNKVGFDQERRWPADCFCEDIAILLPQLHHVHLRKGYLCSQVFKTLADSTSRKMNGEQVQTWPLRSLTIRLDMDSRWLESPENASYCTHRTAATAPSDLSTPLREANSKGLLPDLKSAIIISKFGERLNLTTARRSTHSGFAVHNIVRDCTTLIPVMAVEEDSETSFVRSHDAMNKAGDLFLMRDLDGLDRFATYPHLSKMFEGPTHFRELIKMRETPLYELDLTQLDLREEVKLPEKVRMSLWAREAKTGQCLLCAKEVQGLGMPPVGMDEYLPPGWTYGINNKKGERQIVRISEG
jgi:hypothetical protein